jgi:hypothetical protein
VTQVTSSPAVREADDGSVPGTRCIRTARPVGDPHLVIGGRIRPPRDPVAIEAISSFERQLARPTVRGWALAAVAVLGVTVLATVAWTITRGWGDVVAAVVAVVSGIALGAVAVAASGWRHGWHLSALAVAGVIVAMVLSANFVQRSQLQDGIDTLQPRWEAMRAMADAASDEPSDEAAATGDTDTDTGGATETTTPAPTDTAIGGGGGTMIPDDAALAEDTLVGGILVPAGSVIPPPEIVAVMPTPAFDLMGPEVMAVVWPDIPDERKAELDPALVAEVTALIDAAEQAEGAEAASESGGSSGTSGGGLTLAEARAIYSESNYDIPEPVLQCAPPPDLTQPDAAAGLGFPDGVPLFLPLSDYYQTRVRGDGLAVAAPTPWCFASENAKAEPIEAASWVAAVLLAALIPARRRLALVTGGARRRTRYEQVAGAV